MNMRPAKQLLDELASYVGPPRGIPIFLTESIPSSASELNWVPIMGSTSAECNDRFEHKAAGLRKSDPIVDWSGIYLQGGQSWRVVKWVSDIPPSAARYEVFLQGHEPTLRQLERLSAALARAHSAFRASIND